MSKEKTGGQRLKVEQVMIPHEVVGATVDGATPLRAWREHLQLTQGEVALRLGISVAAYTVYGIPLSSRTLAV